MWGLGPLSPEARDALLHALGRLPAGALRSKKPSLVGTIAFALVFVCAELDRLWLGSGVLTLLSVGAFLCLALAPGVYCRLAEVAIRTLVRRGRYDRAIRIAHGWTRRWQPARRARLSACALLAAGRLDDAEREARAGLEAARSDGMVESLLEILGDALREQGRYDEAWRCYESTVRLAKTAVHPQFGMTLTLLRKGQSGEALVYATQAQALAKRTGGAGASLHAATAWALAGAGHGEEAEAALRAVQPSRSVPIAAQSEYLAGMAGKAAGNCDAAAARFQRAREIDPTGWYGTLAARELAERGFTAPGPGAADSH